MDTDSSLTEASEETRAFLEFLSRIDVYRGEATLNSLRAFAALFDDPLEDIIEYCVQEALLVPPDASNFLDYLKVTEIKALLRTAGLKVSGRKAELIARLRSEAPAIVENAAVNADWLILGPEAQDQVATYQRRCEEEREQAELATFKALKDGQVANAIRAIFDYKASGLWVEDWVKRGYEDWTSEDLHTGEMLSVGEELGILCLGVSPGVLRDVTPEELEALQLAAAMSLFWSDYTNTKWLPADFSTESCFDAATEVQLIRQAADYKFTLSRTDESYRRIEAAKICAHFEGPCCDYCAQQHEQAYPLDSIPELPHLYCTSDRGCTCSLKLIESAIDETDSDYDDDDEFEFGDE